MRKMKRLLILALCISGLVSATAQDMGVSGRDFERSLEKTIRKAERMAMKAARQAEQTARRAERTAEQASRYAEQAARQAEYAVERAGREAERMAEQVARHAEYAAEKASREAERAAGRVRPKGSHPKGFDMEPAIDRLLQDAEKLGSLPATDRDEIVAYVEMLKERVSWDWVQELRRDPQRVPEGMKYWLAVLPSDYRKMALEQIKDLPAEERKTPFVREMKRTLRRPGAYRLDGFPQVLK